MGGGKMIHLGDITRIHGAGAPIVEVIIGGSPCQDLSVAGKRAGLAGERSGLFMDQVRIVKEMRDYDARVNARTGDDVRPRYMVWENVPGAFSSNGGEDFRAVLEEIARVVEKDAVIPEPPNEKWQTAGCVVGDGWSIAWRVLDAQFWGVPQRRRRIALVADFGGDTAPEILFEREGVSGDSQESGTQGERTAGDAEESFRKAVCYSFDALASNSMKPSNPNSGCREVECSKTLDCFDPNPSKNQGGIAVVQPAICIQGNCIDRADTAGCNGKGWRDDDVSFTLNTIDRPAVYDARGNGDGTTAPTLTGDHQNRVTDYTAVCIAINTMIATRHNAMGERTGLGIGKDGDSAYTISSAHEHAVYSASGFGKYKSGFGTLRASGGDYVGGTETLAATNLVRRLTPLECERLQGYPDGWTDIGEWIDSKGKKHESSDSARYKALGNSIALPPWRFVLSRVNTYLKEHTMASLFDGIGGFPLIWQELNGPGKCLWASEIEEFPIAVTKLRFKNT